MDAGKKMVSQKKCSPGIRRVTSRSSLTGNSVDFSADSAIKMDIVSTNILLISPPNSRSHEWIEPEREMQV
jgi:hypothetical protein